MGEAEGVGEAEKLGEGEKVFDIVEVGVTVGVVQSSPLPAKSCTFASEASVKSETLLPVSDQGCGWR